MRNEKNILRHEIIGLPCKVISAQNSSHVGTSGKIVDETIKTVLIKDMTKKRIPKKGTVFRMRINTKEVDIEGDYLVARPEDRIKKKFMRW